MKTRLDRLIAERGLVESREKAQALIMAGEVLVNGQKAAKPGQAVADDSRIEILARPPYVSRGGLKLAGALGHFAIGVAGQTCLDIGASTGGFTDVVLHEGINARALKFEDIGERVDLIVCHVAFISVTLILPAAVPLLQPAGQMVILIKPQFEAGRGQVGKGGIVRDPAIHQAACERVAQAVRALGFETSMMESPILGAEGNKEFLLYAHH